MRKFHPFKAYLAIAAGAILTCFSFPTWSQFYCAFFVFPFYLSALTEVKNKKAALLCGFFGSFIIGLGGFSWIAYVLQNFGQLPAIAAYPMLLGYGVIAEPHFYIFFLLGFILKPKIEKLPFYMQAIFWPALFVSLEFFSCSIKIFSEYLGNSQLPWLALSQNVAWGGMPVLSFLVILPGSFCFYFLKTKNQKTLSAFLLSMLCLVLAVFWGTQHIKKIQAQASQEIHIAMIQSNIEDWQKVVSETGDFQAVQDILDQYIAATKEAIIDGAELVLWPETAHPLNFPTVPGAYSSTLGKSYALEMQNAVRTTHGSLLFGGYEKINKDEYNSAILLGPQGEVQGMYRKESLLIFGEYLPFSKWFPSIKAMNPQLGDFTPGPGAIPLQWKRANGKTLALGLSICYEALRPHYIRTAVKNGARLLVNVTNDSWFGPTMEPWQHLALTIFRSIEMGLPMIRSTNSGLSVAVDGTGKILEQGPLFQAAIIHAKVPIPIEYQPTLYTKIGDSFVYFLLLLCCALVIII